MKLCNQCGAMLDSWLVVECVDCDNGVCLDHCAFIGADDKARCFVCNQKKEIAENYQEFIASKIRISGAA